MRADYAVQKQKYAQQGAEIQQSAENDGALAAADERRALRYDIGEGLFEIAVVLTSLYFISRKNHVPRHGHSWPASARPGGAAAGLGV